MSHTRGRIDDLGPILSAGHFARLDRGIAMTPRPKPADIHPMRCAATDPNQLRTEHDHTHTCIHPARQPFQTEGAPVHLCWCGVEWSPGLKPEPAKAAGVVSAVPPPSGPPANAMQGIHDLAKAFGVNLDASTGEDGRHDR